MKKVMLAILLILSVFSKSQAQIPEVFEKTETYKVFGNSERSLRENLDKNSPCKQDGKIFDAFTTWYVKWFFKWKYNEGKFEISEANSNVEIKFVMPDWVDKSKASNSLQKKWEKYFAALQEHEAGHRNIGVEAAKAVIVAIKNVPPAFSSETLEKNANAAANRVLERYRTQEEEYDRLTEHGETTGAIFP